MSEYKIKHLAVWCVWLALHIIPCCFRLSWDAAIVLTLGALILLLSTACREKYESGFMYQTMGILLGVSVFVRMGWYLTETILPQFMQTIDPWESLMEAFWPTFYDEVFIIWGEKQEVHVSRSPLVYPTTVGLPVVPLDACIRTSSSLSTAKRPNG